ncbi:MAG: hypothetical protein KDA60_04060 [Planctomycetales bacterium]|nr:hypothetical protein [Planctomycetales bacterium]
MRRLKAELLGMLGVIVILSVASSAMGQDQDGQRRGTRIGRDSLLGLLRIEEVRKELDLAGDTAAKVAELTEQLGSEMRDKMGSLRDIEDREERRAKMDEVRSEFDTKTREQLRDILSREQMRRLFQVRMQNRSTLDSLTNPWIARRLELTDEQNEKLSALNKEFEAKQSELRASMRDASGDQRSESFQKLRDHRNETDEKALGVLTDEQKTRLEEMKGEKLELPQRGRRAA